MFTLITTVFTGIGAMMFSKSSIKAGQVKKSSKSFYDIPVKDINGGNIDLKSLRGKKVMIVNVASKCGYTGQYADLQDLYE